MKQDTKKTQPKSGFQKGKRYSKGADHRPSDKEFDRPAPKFNDIQWYTKYPELSEIAGKLGFNHIGGKPYEGALRNTKAGSTNPAPVLPLNILDMHYITTPGIISDSTSGFVMQIRRLYLAMKRKYRGLNTYEIADLGMTIYAIAEFYRLVAKLERIYGVFNYFNPKNRIIPQQLAIALRVNRDNIYNHLADFRAGINALIVKAQSLCLPAGMDVLNRWFLLESNVFKDSQDDRACYIVFDDLNRFYTYQPTWSSTGGSVVLSSITAAASNPNAMTYNELLDAANDVLDILLNDSDITLQLGDIISYFTSESGQTDLMVLQTIPEDYVVVPSYNEEVLLQVHNCNTTGDMLATNYAPIYSSVTPSNFDVGARGSLIYYDRSNLGTFVFMYQLNAQPIFNIYQTNYETASHEWLWDQSVTNAGNTQLCKPGPCIINTWKEVPTSDDVMEMTRLTAAITTREVIDGTAVDHELKVDSCGTEVILGFYLLRSDLGNISFTTLHGTAVYTGFGNDQSALMSQIDWHPMVYHFTQYDAVTTAGNGYILSSVVLADLDNARVVQTSDLKMMHDAALMSEFSISSVKALTEHTK